MENVKEKIVSGRKNENSKAIAENWDRIFKSRKRSRETQREVDSCVKNGQYR